jgi:hypothetical protein
VECAVLAVAFFALGRQSTTALNVIYPLGILAGSIPIFLVLIRELGASPVQQALVFIREAVAGVLGFAAGTAALAAVAGHSLITQLLAGGSVAFAAAIMFVILTDARQLMRIAGLAQKPQAR